MAKNKNKHKSKTTFTLKGMSEIFTPTDPERKLAKNPVINLSLDKLISFEKHPFKLYDGKLLSEMVESVRENGVIMPIIVRPKGAVYEILSGHNRANAAKAAGHETIPAIVREGLTDDEAMLIVTETNLLQRSFADLSHSERAVALLMHHESIKKQGRRTDLIEDIENMLNTNNISNQETSGAMRQKSDSRQRMAAQFDLSSRTIAYYLRLNKLIEAHMNRLDEGKLALRAAVTLSYLSENDQRVVDEAMQSLPQKVDMKTADALRSFAENGPIDREKAEIIISGAGKNKVATQAGFRVKPQIIARYFKTTQKQKEIEEIIIKALDNYFAQHGI